MRTNRVLIMMMALVGLVLTGCSNSSEPDKITTIENVEVIPTTYAMMDGDEIAAVYTLTIDVSYTLSSTGYVPVEHPRWPPQIHYGEIPDDVEQADLLAQSIPIRTGRVNTQATPPGPTQPAAGPKPATESQRNTTPPSVCSNSAEPDCRKQIPFDGNAAPINGIAQIGDMTFGVHAQLRWSWAETDNELDSDVAFYNQYVHDADRLRESGSLGAVNLATVTQAIANSGEASLQATGWSRTTTDQFVADNWKNGNDPIVAYWNLTGETPSLGQEAVYEFGCVSYEVASNDGQQFIEPLKQQFGDEIVVNGLEPANDSSIVTGPTPEPCGVTIVTK